MVKLENIFKGSQANLERESVKELISRGKIIRLESVVSPRSNTPSEVYDQNEDEFVILLKGSAELKFYDGRTSPRNVSMRRGNYVNIPAHLKHSVVKTKKGTVWLALFYKK